MEVFAYLSVDLPIIPFRIMTSEYKSQLVALMMEKFNKLGRGTFGDGTKIYNHGRAKPSLGKVILDLALLARYGRTERSTRFICR